MKRIIIFFLIVVLLPGCNRKSDIWKIVDIGDCGSMKIPQDWQCVMEDDLIYILNENSEPIIIEYKETNSTMSNKYYSDFLYKKFIASAVLSNGAIYGKAIIMHENTLKELLYLKLGYGDTERHFLVWDETLGSDELKALASTFIEKL